jgi:hypothetical protein
MAWEKAVDEREQTRAKVVRVFMEGIPRLLLLESLNRRVGQGRDARAQVLSIEALAGIHNSWRTNPTDRRKVTLLELNWH